MPIETNCQTCGQRLRVGDEHAGKLARCPACQTVYTVPGLDPPAAATQIAESASPASPQTDVARWHLKTPDGLTFGPVTRAELDAWQREGRITAQSQLREEPSGHWIWSGQVYPQLQSFAETAPPKSETFTTLVDPYGPPGYTSDPYSPMGQALEAHHGGAILALAILGWCACDILTVVAVAMAIIDLVKMNRGAMDPGGRGLTIAALVIAGLKLVGLAMWLLYVLIELLV